ncbi:hypothetical protein [Tautonia plasticadhaerens]|uniref:Uncharacterized protein n=1 Tax=Tautonia plasticadhaerens TaxID=2527974 RepID=A0A518H4M9_9BACT|nr:hypothetical protein [Tautonia plasticadhaerens]QDV35799.1 hypothetical protein ElP_37070 [Tautonia plasticadhaerens]
MSTSAPDPAPSSNPPGPRPGTGIGPGAPTGNRNAASHGLTARLPLCEAEAERLHRTVESWTAQHLPTTEPEADLIRSAAIEAVRYRRCVEAEERALRPRAREALLGWEEKRRHAIRRKAQDLRDDLEGVLDELTSSAFGIDWLLRHWRALLGLLSTGRGWRGDDLVQALRLLGRPPRRPERPDLDARLLWDLAAVCCPATVDAAAPPGVTGPAEAAGRLRDLVADRIARLEALRPVAWEAVEGPMAEAVEAAAMVDTSPEGLLRQRYRREALRDRDRSLALILRLRVERSKIDERAWRLAEKGQSLRTPVGGGWWRETDAWPAPPGCIPRPPAPDPAPAPDVEAEAEVNADPVPPPGPTPPPGDRPAPPDPRNNPRNAAPADPTDRPKSNPDMPVADRPLPADRDDPRRTPGRTDRRTGAHRDAPGGPPTPPDPPGRVVSGQPGRRLPLAARFVNGSDRPPRPLPRPRCARARSPTGPPDPGGGDRPPVVARPPGDRTR